MAAIRLFYFVSFGAMGLYLPYFPRWLGAHGVAGLELSVLAATLPALGVLGPPLFGLLADWLGLRGGLLRVTCAGALAGFVVLALAARGGAHGAATLWPGLALFAFFRSPTSTMADVLALERAGSEGYARLRLWGSVGFMLAALGFGRLGSVDAGWQLPGAITLGLAAVLVAAFALPARVDRPAMPPLGAVGRLVRARDFQLLLVTALLSQVGHSAYDLAFSLHLYDLGLGGGTVGVAWTLGVVAEIALMALGGPLFRRVPARSLLAVGLAGASLRWGLVAVVRQPVLLLALQPLHALSFAMVWLASVQWLKARVPAEALATGQSLYVASIAVGSVVGMLLWGPLFAARGGAAVFSCAAAAAALACGVALIPVGPPRGTSS